MPGRVPAPQALGPTLLSAPSPSLSSSRQDAVPAASLASGFDSDLLADCLVALAQKQDLVEARSGKPPRSPLSTGVPGRCWEDTARLLQVPG